MIFVRFCEIWRCETTFSTQQPQDVWSVQTNSQEITPANSQDEWWPQWWPTFPRLQPSIRRADSQKHGRDYDGCDVVSFASFFYIIAF
jgi:hypothetical protein